MDYNLKEDWVEYFFDKVKYLTLPSEENNYKSKLLESNTLLYCVVLLLMLKIATIFIFVNIPQNIFFADITRTALENFVNQTRQSSGLQPLVQNSKLDEAARLKAQNMVAGNYFAHTSPTGLSPWHWFVQAGYNYKYAGENLAIGFFDSDQVYQAWLNSPEHKANILNPNYKEIGTAVLNGFGGNNSIVVVQEFGSQKPLASSVPAQNKNTVVGKTVPAQQKQAPVVVQTGPASAVPVPKVLSQSTQSSIVPSAVKSKNSDIYSEIINSVLNYRGLLQDVIYGISLVFIGIFITLIYANISGGGFKRELVIRSVVIVILLSLATFLNKEVVSAIIPHYITVI